MSKLIALFLLFFVYSASGSGQFVVLQHPDTVDFIGKDVIDGRDIPLVLAVSLGFTTQQSSEWPGMIIKSPFGFSDVMAVVAIEGVTSLGSFDKHPVYPIDPVHEEYQSWKTIEEEVLEHYPLQKNTTLRRIELGSGVSDLSNVEVTFLDKMNEEDEAFLQDWSELNTYIQDFEQNGVPVEDTPILQWFTLSSLHLLSDVKGADHEATLEAKKMIHSSLVRLGNVLNKASNGRSFVAAIVTDASHTRHIRAADGDTNNTIPTNRATVYSESYPAIFTIMLFFGIGFVFSLIAISYFIGNMDPGRDSIIYRMTSNRMKKDS